MMRRATAVGLAAAVLAVAGCGGDDDGGNGGGGNGGGPSASADEAAVRQALEDFFQALADKEAEKACSFLSADAKEKAAATVPGTDTCEEGTERILDLVDSRQRESLPEQLEDTKVVVEVDGDEAEVLFPERPDAQPVPAVREGGVWKIDHNPLTFKPNQ
jgi:ketosteroid isomerase-like protein